MLKLSALLPEPAEKTTSLVTADMKYARPDLSFIPSKTDVKTTKQAGITEPKELRNDGKKSPTGGHATRHFAAGAPQGGYLPGPGLPPEIPDPGSRIRDP